MECGSVENIYLYMYRVVLRVYELPMSDMWRSEVGTISQDIPLAIQFNNLLFELPYTNFRTAVPP